MTTFRNEVLTTSETDVPRLLLHRAATLAEVGRMPCFAQTSLPVRSQFVVIPDES